MSLKLRLNLVINLLFLLFMAGLCAHAIVSARQAVAEETRSAANLTSRLLGIILSPDGPRPAAAGGGLLDELRQLEATRHLRVRVYRAVGERHAPPEARRALSADAPSWFVALVRPPPMEFRRVVASGERGFTGLAVVADPSDEITEAWHETRDFLLSLLVFTALANGLIFFVLSRDLAPIRSILAALERIEKGDYRRRLPSFGTPEFSAISAKFNLMTAALSTSREENHRLTQRLLEIQEQERRALARDLHDELGQTVSAIKAVAVAMGRERGSEPAAVAERAALIGGLSDEIYAVARRLSRQLRPAALDELGLVPALQEMIDDWNGARAETFCHLDLEGDYGDLDEARKIHLYRIAQEGLSNISRHAAAAAARIVLRRRADGGLVLTIRDDGRGFAQQSAAGGRGPGPDQRQGQGLGLLGIRERVERLAGEMRVAAAPGKGVELTVVLPPAAGAEEGDSVPGFPRAGKQEARE